MTLKIISAAEIAYDGEIKSVTLPGTKGEFTVLNNHASLISTLSKGKITFTNEAGQEESRMIDGGLADVDNNVISVCIF